MLYHACISFLLTKRAINFGHVRMYVTLYPLDYIYIRFGTKLYRQIVSRLMGRNCAPLVADLFFFYFATYCIRIHGFSFR